MSREPEEMNEDFEGREPDVNSSAEFKAFEAELAALRPRDDRLDRERLIFLAGQASVTRQTLWQSNLTWPGAFAGMSAIAATLLVMLLVQTRSPSGEQASAVAMALPGDGGQVNAETENVQPVPLPMLASEPESSNGILAVPFPDAIWTRSRAEYLEKCDWMLTQGVDPWTRPQASSPKADTKPPPAPLPYRQWRRTLLEDQARMDLPGSWSSVSFESGANS